MNPLTEKNIRFIFISALTLYFFRAMVSWDIRFVFLNWNLFLAWLPVYFARKLNKSSGRPFQVIMLALAWFFFLPNSFYIFTDLVHLQWSKGFWKAYDSILILAFALSGAAYGFLSIHLLKEPLERFFRALSLDHIRGMFALLLLCSFGVYIGRIGRWNTWDLVFNPMDFFQYVFEITRLSNANVEVFIFTGLFWLFLVLIYTVVYQYSLKREMHEVHS